MLLRCTVQPSVSFMMVNNEATGSHFTEKQGYKSLTIPT